MDSTIPVLCVGPGRKPRRPVFSRSSPSPNSIIKGTQCLFAVVEADVKPYGGHNSISVNHTRYSLQYRFLEISEIYFENHNLLVEMRMIF